MEEVSQTAPEDVDPYATLELNEKATSAEVKASYRKLALRYHPDKAGPSQQATAHVKFQRIAFAYAILSDERRRKRYDATGNTSESLDLEDDDFDWTDFFRAQWKDAITAESLQNFKSTYQGSEEERGDVIKAFKNAKGDMNRVFEEVMLSNPIDDEQRYRSLINEAIKHKSVEAYDKYINEPEGKRKRRLQKAQKEAKDALKHAETIKKGKGSNSKNKKDNHDDLAALIQQRQQSRSGTFLDKLEAKYAGSSGQGAKAVKKKRKHEEPPEEAFARSRAKVGNSKSREEVSEEDRHLQDDENVDDDTTESEDDSDEEEDVHPPKKKTKARNRKKDTIRGKKTTSSKPSSRK